MARCYVCHRRPPYKRMRATFDVARIAGRKICISVSLGRSSVAGGGFLFPPCLRAFSPSGAQSSTLSNPPAARPRPCALTLDPVCALPIPPLPIRSRRWSRAHPDASPLRRAPSLSLSPGFVLPLVALAPPRIPTHARRAGDFPTVERRGWSRSSARGTPSAECGCKRLFTGCAGAVLLRRENKLFNIVKGIGLMDKKKGRVPLFLLLRVNLRRYAALSGYVLRIVVYIDTKTRIGAEFANDCRHQQFVALAKPKCFVFLPTLAE